MLKGAWILPAVMLVALLVAGLVPAVAFAQDNKPFGPSTQTYFKDLPGVVPEEQRVKPDDYRCTSDIGHVSRSRGPYEILGWDDMPVRRYHCTTKSGTTYTGTQMPNTHWVPGLNPHHLPK